MNQETIAIVESQNRTTHAVRAIATFLLYSVVSGAVGGLIIGFSYANALNGDAQSAASGFMFGIVVAGLGQLLALVVALGELKKSVVGFREDSRREIVQAKNSTESETQRVALSETDVVCRQCGAVNNRAKLRCSKCDGLLR